MKNSCHILLVEDDPDDIELLKEALKEGDIDCTLETLMQGNEVIPRLEKGHDFPNLIILDLNLPKMNGKDILKFIKSSEQLKNIPVLVLTTSSSVEEKESCVRAGAAMYISKPTTMDGFNQIVTAISILSGII